MILSDEHQTLDTQTTMPHLFERHIMYVTWFKFVVITHLLGNFPLQQTYKLPYGFYFFKTNPNIQCEKRSPANRHVYILLYNIMLVEVLSSSDNAFDAFSAENMNWSVEPVVVICVDQ